MKNKKSLCILTITCVAMLVGCNFSQPPSRSMQNPMQHNLVVVEGVVQKGAVLKFLSTFSQLGGSNATVTYSVTLPSGVRFVGAPPVWANKLANGEVITMTFEVAIDLVSPPTQTINGIQYPYIQVGAIDSDGTFTIADYDYVYLRQDSTGNSVDAVELSSDRYFGNPPAYSGPIQAIESTPGSFATNTPNP